MQTTDNNLVARFLAEELTQRDPHFRHNAVQIAYAASVSESLAGGPGRFNFIEGDTGIGKSLAYLLNLADWVSRGIKLGRQAVIATHSRALQRQLLSEENQQLISDYLNWAGLPEITIGLRMGRVNYAAPHRVAQALGVTSLESVLSHSAASDTARYLAQWALRGGLVHEISEDVLPEGVALSDIVLHPSDELPEEISAVFEKTQSSDIQVINHALLALDLVQGNRITGTDTPVALLLDEAEHFPSVAQAMLSDRLSFWMAKSLLKRHNQHRAAEHWDEMFKQWQDMSLAGRAKPLTLAQRETLLEALQRLARARPTATATREQKYDLAELKDMGERIRAEINGKAERLVLSYSQERGYPSIVLLDSAGGSVLKIGNEKRVTLLTSATLSDMNQVMPMTPPTFDYLRRQLLIPAGDAMLNVTASFQASDFGELNFRLPGGDMPPLVRSSDGEYALNPALAIIVWKDLETFGVEGRTLLLCASYRDVDILLEHLPVTLRGRVVTNKPGEALNEMAERMPIDGILLTPAGWEGLSPQRQNNKTFWAHVGIIRNPSPRPDPIQQLVNERRLARTMRAVDAARASQALLHQEGHVRTLHKLRQGLGRAIRHPSDKAWVTFYDPRFPIKGIGQSSVKVMPWLSTAIPFRFHGALTDAQAAAVKQHHSVGRPEKKPFLIR
jgi:hypothetical protein